MVSSGVTGSLQKGSQVWGHPRPRWRRNFYFKNFPFETKEVFPLFGHSWKRISNTLGSPVSKKSNHHSGPSPMRPKKLRINPDTEPPGFNPWLSTELVVGPFKEEAEEIIIASDVDTVEGEDPATIHLVCKCSLARVWEYPGTVMIPEYRFNQGGKWPEVRTFSWFISTKQWLS